MSHNPYSPPQAEVGDAAREERSEGIFFATSGLKILILSLATLGLYQFYWFYKHWKLHKDRTGEEISPFWRAFFAVFFCYSLFCRIRDYEEGSEARLPAGALATAWIITSVLWRLPDPYWLVTYLSCLALIPVQSAVNRLNATAAPEHDPNTQFSAWNWVAIVLGLPLLALAIYGTLLPSE